jgi:hypothetical protein
VSAAAAASAPFVRPLFGPGDPRHSKPGKDVVAIARGLARAGVIPWDPPFSPAYDNEKAKAVQRFQRDHGILATGKLGRRTFEALRNTHAAPPHEHEWALDDFAVELLRQAAHDAQPTPEQKARHLIADAAAWWIMHRDEIAYSQARAFPVVKPPDVPHAIDCSGFAADCFYAGGAPDPNTPNAGPIGRVNPYSGLGYTGTLVANGDPVALHDVGVGCLAFYGHTPASEATSAFPAGSPTHVAVCIGGGYVASHGGQSGPLKRDLDYRGDLHSVRRYPLT